MMIKEHKVAIIGLGYVGLPLAVEFGKKYNTVGWDINHARLDELISGVDSTLELNEQELNSSEKLSFSSDIADIADCDIYIVTVPTPIDENKQPDLGPLLGASETISKVLKAGDIVIYESTVYPGATEEECVPILAGNSGLVFNRDFFVGYSPERVNPGDKDHRVTDIVKVTSGSTPSVAKQVDQLYSSVIAAGTYLASSIQVAEAAKVIENTQRDVNIGLINELAVIFNRLEIDTEEVLKAAGTKWNFLPFRPGLVGGHCIGVDPYYLTYKAQSVGLNTEMILAGRRVNDSMGAYVAGQLVKKMVIENIPVKRSKVLVMGFTFKEDCPDIRNTKVIDVVRELDGFGIKTSCYDPWVVQEEVASEYQINMITKPDLDTYDAIIITVAHQVFKEMGCKNIRSWGVSNHILFDVKGIFDAGDTDVRL